MRHLFILSVVVCLAFVSLSSCAPPAEEQAEPEVSPAQQVDVSADKQAITKVGEQLVTALNSDDVDGIMACLTDDHLTMAPDVPILDDLSALRKWHVDRTKEVSLDIVSTRPELEIIGDWAYQRFSTSMKITPKAGGDPTQIKTKGIWIWKRQADGSWKLARSIWNSDNPPPAGEASS